jgi:hypothetical protein
MALHASCTCDIPRGKKLTLKADHTCVLEDSDPPTSRSEKSFHSLSEAMNALTKSGIRGGVVKGADGRWYVETTDQNTTTERFQKMQQSHKELSPGTVAFLRKMIAKPTAAEQVLKEIHGTTLDNRERAEVLTALEPSMAASIRAQRRVMQLGAQIGKRAGMSPLSGLTPSLPTPRPQPTRGLSTDSELEDGIVSEALTPAEAARQFMDRRREMRREGMPGMRPTLRTDAYGAKD